MCVRVCVRARARARVCVCVCVFVCEKGREKGMAVYALKIMLFVMLKYCVNRLNRPIEDVWYSKLHSSRFGIHGIPVLLQYKVVHG